MRASSILGLLTAVLALSFGSPLTAQTYVLRLPNLTIQDTDTAQVPVLLDVSGNPVQGWQYGVCHDSTILDLGSLASGATTAGLAPSFEALDIVSGGFVHGVVIDFATIQTLGTGSGYELAVAFYDPLTTSITTGLDFCDTLSVMGGPLIDVVVTVDFDALVPTLVPGSVTIEPTGFIRGDASGDLFVTLVDSVYLLDYLYLGGPPPRDCSGVFDLDSGDVNDNEFITVADPLELLYTQFCGGTIPGPTICGVDLTGPDLFPSPDPGFVVEGTLIPSPITTELLVRIDTATSPMKALSIALDFGTQLSNPSFELAPGVSAGVMLYQQGQELMLVLQPEGPCGTILTAGVNQLLGSFVFDSPGVVCPDDVAWIDFFVLNGITHWNTMVGTAVGVGRDFWDRHPVTMLDFECPHQFIRGDANADGLYDIADPIFTLDVLFGGSGIVAPCDDAADANDDGLLDIADSIYTLSALFSSGPLPPAPHPFCGPDPTPDVLTCDLYPPCSI